MFNEIDKHITRCHPFSATDLELFHARLKRKNYRKKTVLLSQGEVCRFEAYIVSGCVKKYYIDRNGDEVILQFAVEDWWISDIGSFSEQKPSNLFIETLEDTELLIIDYESKELLYQQLPHLERVFRLMLQRSYSVLENRFYATVSHTAEQRYLDFMSRYPTIPQRVPQTQIASYLGITPESLSRIRSNLHKKKSG
ncbi:Crp/Fnr family transcriptional regulator [Pedobacter sp. SYSU D00535]|uniref:Crp/Fnr family transcriptional regulator n=1 Tax=Pedobacter sp. SYSU D00535 TaxID=2810308 RepID=UPI001A976859|nr:Crp/Fnr family transcriptional regulator [Pedobacter sp. SYSU D00535]